MVWLRDTNHRREHDTYHQLQRTRNISGNFIDNTRKYGKISTRPAQISAGCMVFARDH